MSPAVVGLLGVVALMALIVLRVPIAVALGLVGVLGYAVLEGWASALDMMGRVPLDLETGYSLSVVPLFILMGVVATRAQMSRELFHATNAIFSGARGALASATIGACAAFGAICGSSLATAATMAKVAVPEMQRYGYDTRLATGSVASGGTLGILIPPSVILIIYAIIAEESVEKLFAAGLVPGILLAAFHILVIMALARLRPGWMPPAPSMRLIERLRAAIGMWKLVLLFTLAVVGIYAGFYTPTEAAAISALAAILLAFATRAMSWRGLIESLLEAAFTTGMLFLVVIGAFMMQQFIVLTRLPVELVALVKAAGINATLILVVMVLFYIVLGCFLETVSMILITVPVFLPLILDLGYSPVWFGILVVVVAEVGLITPPVGLNIFVIRSQLPEIPLGTVYRGVIPFLAADALLIIVLLALPAVALWLPDILTAAPR